MRSSVEIKKIVLDKAASDPRIRAVLLNGSRANPNIEEDIFQDFDVVYFVTEMESFLLDPQWIEIFGDRIIMQLPDDMVICDEKKNSAYHYLMLFDDRNRIDLTLFPLDKLNSEYSRDSLTVLLLDKDNLFPDPTPPNEKDYLINKPTAKEFGDCCNEFWWVCTYVAKGLWRKEITYAKDMLENPVRKMFFKMIEWKIGVENDFMVSFGKSGKNMKKYLSPGQFEKILLTYPDHKPEHIRESLFLMTSLFGAYAKEISFSLRFSYDEDEEKKVTEYLKKILLG